MVRQRLRSTLRRSPRCGYAAASPASRSSAQRRPARRKQLTPIPTPALLPAANRCRASTHTTPMREAPRVARRHSPPMREPVEPTYPKPSNEMRAAHPHDDKQSPLGVPGMAVSHRVRSASAPGVPARPTEHANRRSEAESSSPRHRCQTLTRCWNDRNRRFDPSDGGAELDLGFQSGTTYPGEPPATGGAVGCVSPSGGQYRRGVSMQEVCELGGGQ